MEKKIYQIEVVNATNKQLIENKIPNELFSFEVFKSEDDAHKWMKLYGNKEEILEYKVVEYNESDIEDYSFVLMNK